jgi:hypothetical protein
LADGYPECLGALSPTSIQAAENAMSQDTLPLALALLIILILVVRMR